MQWGESLRFAWSALNHDKLKAALTMLGVVIGSAAVVLVVTIASVGKHYIVAQIEGIGANLTYATLDRTGHVVPADELSPADLDAARYLPEVTAAAGTYDLPVVMNAGVKVVHGRLVGVTEDFQQIRNLRITAGRYFDDEDFASRGRVCLVTDHVAQTAFSSNAAALEHSIRMDNFRCTIIGTFTETVSTFGQSEIQENTLLVPFPLIRIINGNDFFQVIYVQSSSAERVPGLTEDIGTLLRRRHRPEAKYKVENLSSLLSTAREVSFAMTAVLIGVALITLTSGGIGIMNIMLVNVAQRVREIGIRRAIGARQTDIRIQFLLEAVFISVCGAMIGVGLAVVLIGSVAAFGLAPISISWIGIVVTIVVAAGTGVIFGYEPASRAARLDPVDAMRSE
jgi:putative ABC transport system permease protein